MNAEEYDLIIIGWGAAGFSAAIKASELSNGDIKIAMVGAGPLGGTCVNVGCVPSKYAIEASNLVFNPGHPKMKGISNTEVKYGFKDVMEGLRSYVENARKNKYEEVIANYKNVSLINGKARFIDRKTVEVMKPQGGDPIILIGSNILISTGSSPAVPNIDGLEETKYLVSDNIWELDRLPDSIIIVGGGAIGLEIGQAFHHFGSDVTIVEALDYLLPQAEPEIGLALKKRLEAEGIKLMLRARVNRVGKDRNGKFMEVLTHSGKNAIFAEEILVSTGRRPNTSYLNLEKAGVKTDSRGLIITDSRMQATVPSIYAAGDCVSKVMFLETLAAREGVVAVNNMFGQDMEIDYDSTTWAVFTTPQVASVGFTERDYSAKTGSCSSRSIQLSNLTKATIIGEDDGVIKMIVDPRDSRVVGLHVYGPNATDIITEGAYAIKNKLTYEDIVATSHIFPSFSEGIKLAAQSFIRDISKMSCCVE